ncbi:sulfite exporter TauE/SafE family protein [Anditalea andensis]|uniref:Urease accessory protein UreH-like transmembrane domain-containing protein n=1 Tax=Anditalea andensis TaxID=1048983 RepID=A0A074L601_9BACT|nr:sulfite exporter TauE/SafE family protein [Anditalea andensis]KEO75263.1 hypothetical protein EL17_01615 [Anditalea andensis]
MELWTAFTLGFVGSFHCIGMCGPIALALPVKSKSSWVFVANRLTYNFGRITTYSIIGLLFGLLGLGFALSGIQKAVSLGLGILVILAVFLSPAISRWINPAGKVSHGVNWVKQKMHLQFRTHGYLSMYTIGLLNGLLPCGLVYLAAAAAVLNNTPWEGAIYMAAFGAGTLPAMLFIIFAGNMISMNFRNAIRKAMPVVSVMMGLLLIIRGLELGIPYMSPVLAFVEKGMTMCGIK